MRKVLLCTMFFVLCPMLLLAQAPDTLWTRTYGGTEDDFANSILLTSNGGYIVVGETHSFGAGSGDVWIIRTDSLGNTLWTRAYGDTNENCANAIQHTTDGAYVIAGNTGPVGGSALWLLKIAENGDTLWTNTFGGCSGYDAKQTSDGGYIITGCKNQPLPYILLIKTDSIGDTLWTKTYGFGCGYSVQQTPDGGYVATGASGVLDVSAFCIFKTDSIGDTLWFKTYHGGTSGGYSLLEATGSGYIACGVFDGVVGIVRTGINGDALWTEGYDFNEYIWQVGYSLISTFDYDYLTVGGLSYSDWNTDALFFKIDSLGNIQWTTILGDSLSDCCLKSVQQTSDNGYVAAGYTNALGAGGSDVWIIKTEPDVGVEETETAVANKRISTTIFSGSLLLPEGKNCRVFDITGRVVAPDKLRPGIYFIEMEGEITQKVVKVR